MEASWGRNWKDKVKIAKVEVNIAKGEAKMEQRRQGAAKI